ncbi:MAG: hypothetical protein RLP11_15700, partial [Marinoscillum sp.]
PEGIVTLSSVEELDNAFNRFGRLTILLKGVYMGMVVLASCILLIGDNSARAEKRFFPEGEAQWLDSLKLA